MEIFIILSFFCVFIVFYYYPSKRIKKTDLGTYHYAHRGLYNHGTDIPENSMMAFRKAKHLGFGCELDVQCTKDGKVVVFHDDNLLRMTGIDGIIESMNYSDIKDLRLNNTEERIPLLSDVLDLELKELVIEIKSTKARRKVILAILKELKSYRGKFSVCSFDPMILLELKRNAPMIYRGLIMEKTSSSDKMPLYRRLVLDYALLNGIIRPDYISMNYIDINFIYRFFRFLGGRTLVWTVRDIQIEHDLKNQVEGVIFENYLPTVKNSANF
jgi:glycerophosphoryl diester phosphodiesterase